VTCRAETCRAADAGPKFCIGRQTGECFQVIVRNLPRYGARIVLLPPSAVRAAGDTIARASATIAH
jgi:hypothetical protein